MSSNEVKPIVNLYVNPNAAQNGNGSKAKPYQTLSEVQKCIHSHPDFRIKPINVRLGSGIYELSEPIVFTYKDSGTQQAPITWESEDKDFPILTASKSILLNWTQYDSSKHIFLANIPDAYQKYFESNDRVLWINNIQLHMARYPNYPGDYDFKGKGVSRDALDETRIKSWQNPQGGIIHGLSHHEWGSVHFKIIGKKNETHLQLQQIPTINREANINPEFRFVENIWEELDTPGEYFYNQMNHTLYLIPSEDGLCNVEILNKTHIRIATNARIISIEGTEVNPVENLQICNIIFQNTQRSLFRTWEPLTRGDWTIVREAAIMITGAKNIYLNNCHFQEIATNAVFLSNNNRNITIEACKFAHIGESAISIVGNHESVRSVAVGYHISVPFNSMDLIPGPRNTNYPADCKIKDCLIHDIGQITKQVAGVFLSMAQLITIEHCSIFNLPRAGICINEGAFGGHIIKDNFIFDSVRETGDHGPINSWGRDRHWKDLHASNPKRDVPDNVRLLSTLDMSDSNGKLLPNIIDHNRFEHSAILHSSGLVSGAFSWGMDLDDGSSNYILRNNLCIGCSFKLREGFNRIVENNICVGPIPPEKHQQYNLNGDIVRRNIIFNTNDTSPFKLSHNGLPQDAKEIDYNLYWSPRGQIDMTYSQENGVELHSLIADPEFIDPENWNFQLKPTSLAFSIGFENFPMNNFGTQIEKFKRTTLEYYNAYRANKSGNDVLSSKLDMPQEWLGATLKNLATEQEKSATGMHAITGVLAIRVPEQSIAAQIGIQEGDVIIRINDSEISDLAEFNEMLLQIENAEESRLIIFRYQKEKELEL